MFSVIRLIGENSFDHRHSVHCEGSRLVGANVGGIAHGFTSGEMANEVLVCQHLLGGKCETDGDGQGQSLGHGHHHNGDSNNEGVERVVKDGDVREVVGLDVELDEHHGNEGGRRSRNAHVSNHGGHVVEFFLQGRLVLLLLEVALDDAPLGVSAHGNGEELSRPRRGSAAR
eukprot:scaffold34398_cov51-Attheya_sp.AAC.4